MKIDIYDISQDSKSKTYNVYTFLAGLCIIIGLILTILLFTNEPANPTHVSLHLQQKENPENPIKDYYSIKGTIGDFISGTVGTLFSLAGFFLIYLTFKNQTENFEIERIENRFFELIKWHRENVNEITYDDAIDEKKKFKGQRVFKFITDQIEECYKEIEPFFHPEPDKIFQKKFLKEMRDISLFRKQVDLTNLAHCEIAYSVVFFGLSDADFNTVSKHLSKAYLPEFFEPILHYLYLKPTKKSVWYKHWKSINKINHHQLIKDLVGLLKDKNYNINLSDHDNHIGDLKVLLSKKFYKYYGGHQFKLGHYFRHLYQAVTYIDSQKIPYSEKYSYIKMLRGQLSTYEQVVFFFNSLSFMGRIWELEFFNKEDPNYQLITKYNLIKNMSELHIFKEIEVKHYYPNVSFEFELKPYGRKKMIEYYK